MFNPITNIINQAHKNIEDIARIWSKVNIPRSNGRPNNKCWEWTGSKTKSGYGIITLNGKNEYVHRLVANLTHDIHESTILHTCDNPGCVRPSHLIVGTMQDNTQDMVKKHRCSHKLTVDEIREIKSSTKPAKELGIQYGVTDHTIRNIRSGKNWKHL